MEVQTCAFESPIITNSNYYYGKINIGSVIMCFLIIYSTAISIVLSVKQLIQVIKDEELIQEMEEEVEVDIQTQVIKEVVKVDVQTQVEEEEEEEKEKDDSEDDSEDEDELLLANYRIKEREQALQEIYKERAEQAVEKWKEAYSNMINYNVGNLLLQSLQRGSTLVCLNESFNKNTEYVNGKAQSTSLKAAMNMIYRLETEEHLVREERRARREAVYAFKKIQFHIHFDFAFDDWSRVLKEEYYPQDALDIIKINKAHKLMTQL